ncbi:reverse transcriptase domain-containing protein [Tanacetum coccineum]
MHVWCGRRSVSGPCSQHARNQTMFRKRGSGDEATITPNVERISKPKRKVGELKQILILIRRKVTSLLQNPQKRSSKRGPFDGKGLTASTSLYRQSFLETPEINYNSMEQLVLSLVHTTRRLRRYLQAHLVMVVTDQPIKQIMSRPENTRRMLKWKFKLEAFDITYRPRTSIRGQILADFSAERPDEEGPSMEVQAEEATPKPWTLFTDGSSCLEGSGARLILISPEDDEFTYALRFEFDASNNEAKYEALVAGLRIAEKIGVKKLAAKVDSRLIANQINGLYKAKEQSMTQYLEKTKTTGALSKINSFEIFLIEQVPQSEDRKAGALSKIVSKSFAYLTKQVLVETLKRKSIEEREIFAVVEKEGHCWMTPLVEYLAEGTLPAEIKKAHTLKIKVIQYAMVNGVLYRKSFLEPWLRCVGPTQAEYVVKEIHKGSCNMHSGPRSMVAKAIRSGYYWSTMHRDAQNIIRKCDDCPFPEVQGRVKFLIVAIDYFTKWIKAKLVATITRSQIIRSKTGARSLISGKVNQAENDEGLLLNLDILEERREKAAIREARNKAKMEKYYNAKVCSTSFHPGDFVYRSNEASHAKESGKLGPKWEGPYEVVEKLGKGVYKLRNGSGDVLRCVWNVQDLKKCYL